MGISSLDQPVAKRSTSAHEAELLRDFWYLVLPGHRLKSARTTSKVVLGEPLLLGRDKTGAPFALRNICPHRGTPLSCGRFDGREIECSYHGWRFGTDGVCLAIPSLTADQQIKLAQIKVRSYPCREVQGNIWVYFGADTSALPDVPQLPEVTEHDYQISISAVFPCDIDHAVIGLVDPAHVPYVHRAWWWRTRDSAYEKQKHFEPSPLGFRMVSHRPSVNSRAYRLFGGTLHTEITFQLPGLRVELLRTGRYVYCGLTAITPIGPDLTEVHHIMYWTTPWVSLLRPLMRPFARAFLNQDRDAVTRQRDGLIYGPKMMFVGDADAQARWYFLLKEEYLEARRHGRPFRNPVPSTVLRWRS